MVVDPAEREWMEQFATLLRSANGPDRRHLGCVNDISVRRENGRIVVVAQAETDIPGELAQAMLKADLFERAFCVGVASEARLAELRA